MVRRSQFGTYVLTEGIDGQTVNKYDPESKRFKVSFDFIRTGWITTAALKKALRKFVPANEVDILVKEMKVNLPQEVGGY